MITRYRSLRQNRKKELESKLTNLLLKERIPLDIVNAETGEILIPANRPITRYLVKKMVANYDVLAMDPSPIRNKLREVIGSVMKVCL